VYKLIYKAPRSQHLFLVHYRECQEDERPEKPQLNPAIYECLNKQYAADIQYIVGSAAIPMTIPNSVGNTVVDRMSGNGNSRHLLGKRGPEGSDTFNSAFLCSMGDLDFEVRSSNFSL
jgi:hypothetical protein